MDEQQPRKINVNIDHGDTFFVNSISIINDPSKFFIDFRQTSPRTDNIENSERVSLVVRHKTVALDPVLAKDFLRILEENVGNYERQFGEIKMPKMPKTDGKSRKNVSKTSVSDHEKYIG